MTLEAVGPEVADLMDVDEIRRAAERLMPNDYRDFVNNVGMDETLRGDLAAWAELRLRPRALTDVSRVDTGTTVLDQRLAMPIITAPYIGSTLVHPEGEVATARGAAAAGSITMLSMNGTRTPEEVGAAASGRYSSSSAGRRSGASRPAGPTASSGCCGS